MKKFSIIIALFLVSVLAIPTFADSLSDVPSDHWAYDAVNELVAAGIVEGYPDGTFKGQRNLSRYEIATIVSRALDNIEQERAALKNEVNAIKANEDKGLNSEEAQDVAAICKSIIEKNMPVQTKVEIPEGLTEKQAAQVANLIDALTIEFETELKSLGRDVEVVEADVADLKTDVSALKSEVAKDTVDFSGTVDTIFQIGDYGDNEQATAEVLSDGDLVDSDLPTGPNAGADYDDFPAEKAFYQKIGLNINGSLNDINLDFAVDTITNGFTDYEGYKYNGFDKVLGAQGDGKDILMDAALLNISKGDYNLKIGDMGDYDVDSNAYFYDVEDAEGVEFIGPLAGLAVKGFAIGFDEGAGNDDKKEDEFYGVAVTKDFGKTQLTGKVYHGRLDSENEKVTDLAVAVTSAVSDVLTVSGEAVYNQLDEADIDDTMFTLGADYKSDVISLRVGYETVGDKFNGGAANYVDVLANLEEDYNYDKYNVGADYIVNANNTVTFDYTNVAYDLGDEDKNIYNLGLDNIMGDFTNNVYVEFVENDGYKSTDDDVTKIGLSTEYAMSDLTTLSAGIINKSADDFDYGPDLEYTYLTAGVDHKLADNITWITDAEYLTGDYNAATHNGEAEGSFLTTKLSVSF